ncbi:MAG: helix-turn-helix domain-containing protein [Mogibacterium sp.]|nr:helix-turn-helix domain-containing protein [Mogibacterium sp.]
MSDLALRLWDILSDKPTPRADLAEMLNVSDRMVRRAIAELRENGYNVACSSHKKGYWRGNDADRRHTIAELQSRNIKLMEVIKAMERGPIDGQEVMSI